MISASLVVVEDVAAGKVLMVENKRGVNAGFFNFPGGKKKNGEEMAACAVREVFEETGITPSALSEVGYIEFAGKDFAVTVYRTSEFSGNLRKENDETRPFWQDRSAMPFHKMRNADSDYVPLVLNGVKFRRRYYYDAAFNVVKTEDI